MPTIPLSRIVQEADKEHGDLKIALDDSPLDEQGEPTGDYCALLRGVRLGKERREKVKELTSALDGLREDSDEVKAQRAKVNAAQNRFDTAATKDTSDAAQQRLADRVEAEQAKLDDLVAKAEEDTDEYELIAQMSSGVCEIIRTVARDKASADRLIDLTKTPEAPDGDIYYLFEIFTAYKEGGDLGETSPSQT